MDGFYEMRCVFEFILWLKNENAIWIKEFFNEFLIIFVRKLKVWLLWNS